VRTIVLQGLDSSDTHHGANNLIYGPDGGIYWQSGVFMQHNYEHPWGPSLQATSSAMYRFDPRRFTISKHADNSPNPHGTSFDYWGYHYATDGTGGRAYQVRPEGNSFKMYELLKKEVRPVTSSHVVSSQHFPAEMQGDFLICNVIGFLGVKQYRLERDADKATVWGEPSGDELKVKVTQADGTVTEETSRGFLMSGDKNFRPSDIKFAPDGSLYLADWQNVIIGHMQHNVRDPNRDHAHGRIYRITATGRDLQKPVAIAGQPIPSLLDVLKHPTDSIRQRARIELSARDSKEVIAATKEWIKQFDATKKEDAHHLLEALWLSSQHNIRNSELLGQLLKSPEPHARNAAKTMQHLWFNVESTLRGGVIAGNVEEKIKITPPAHLPKSLHDQYILGGAVFHRDAHCATCHQPNGEGLLNVYPPLKGSPWVTGSEDRLIKLALHGLWGKIEVNGQVFDSARGVPPMTPFASLLKDNEMAAVLTYVRNSWGNQAPAVSKESVTRVRAATKDRSSFWTPEELLKAHPLEK
jgi:mono/diheme cytochrome c family protein